MRRTQPSAKMQLISEGREAAATGLVPNTVHSLAPSKGEMTSVVGGTGTKRRDKGALLQKCLAETIC